MTVHVRLLLRAEAALCDIEREFRSYRIIRVTYTRLHARVIFQ